MIRYVKSNYDNKELGLLPVSYTHLDVYKRQDYYKINLILSMKQIQKQEI